MSRAKVAGITWPIPPEISDAALEHLLFTPAGFHEGSTKRLPDWTKVHEELKRRGVTLMILWEEHRAEHVDGHGYSRFCELRHALHTAAFWLMHGVRAAIPQTSPLATADFATIGKRLIKIGARVIEHIARIRVKLASSCPERALFRAVALGLMQSGP
jgi:hypothetical protein